MFSDVACHNTYFAFLAIFGAFLPTLSLAKSLSIECPQWVNNRILQCIKPVAKFAQNLNNQSSNPSQSELSQALQFPRFGKEMFQELCSHINDFEICIEGYREKCQKHITIDLIESSYGYLCNEGFTVFMGSADCLIELDQRPSVKLCHDETLKEIEYANSQSDANVLVKLDRMCNALNFFSNCVRHPIAQNCGEMAWDVIFKVLEGTTKTLLPVCKLNSPPSSSETPVKHVEEDGDGQTKDTIQNESNITVDSLFWDEISESDENPHLNRKKMFTTTAVKIPQPLTDGVKGEATTSSGRLNLPNIVIELSQEYPEEQMFDNAGYPRQKISHPMEIFQNSGSVASHRKSCQYYAFHFILFMIALLISR